MAQVLTSLTDDFNKSQSKVTVKPSFTGDYATNLTKVITTVKGGNPPDVTILAPPGQYTLLDLKALAPISELSQKFGANIDFDDFYPAFIKEATLNGKTYGLPFNRSTPILYYNKAALDKIGVTKAPTTWADMVSTSTELMGKKSVDWGLEIPTDIWYFQSLALAAGQDINGADLSHVNLDTPASVDALTWLVDLGKKYKVSPPNVVDETSPPAAFGGNKLGYLYNSSGSIGGITKQAKFEFATAPLPADKKSAVASGGGSLYILSGIPEERQQAAITFVSWLTQPEQAARWSAASGYLPSRNGVTATSTWKTYITNHPDIQPAIDQLAIAVPSLRCHATNQVGKFLMTALQAAVTGKTSPADSLKQAQQSADSVLSQYR